LFLLLGDHAGSCIPEGLARLGLSDAELGRHIALDLGVSALGAGLAQLLDAPFIEQRYSRLVIDCNRAPASDGSILLESDGTPIPGNAGLSDAQRVARRREIFDPYHRAIADALDARERSGPPPVVVALHSFTPRMNGVARPWQVGVLHGDGNSHFACRLLAILQAQSGLVVGDNEPYRMDETDYTVPAHAFASARPYVELEIRQDQLADATGVMHIADVLAKALRAAVAG
jgi:predicted N-formylglutamate amidohydrolase